MTPSDTQSPTKPTGALAAAVRRWPTVVGLALGFAIIVGDVTDETTHQLAGVLVIPALIYVLLAALGRQRWTWPVFFLSFPLVSAVFLQTWVEPAVVLFAAALGATIWGAGHGRHHERDFLLQLVGMVVFGGLAVAGLAIDADLGRYLVAAGWLAHAGWDWVHVARNRVVQPSYAECCAGLDVVIAVGLVVVPLL